MNKPKIVANHGHPYFQFICIGILFSVSACFPNIYIYEQPTILERQASGTYPLLRQSMLEKSEAKGPAMINPKENISRNKQTNKASQVLDGDYTSTKTQEP